MSQSSPARVLVFVAFLFAPGVLGPAYAEGSDRRYCAGFVDRGRKVFISRPFRSPASLDVVEREFLGWLAGRGHAADRALCPRADSAAALAKARRQAIKFNRAMGVGVVVVRWRSQSVAR